jgi:predicted DNA-binding transcriptional regulator YafY
MAEHVYMFSGESKYVTLRIAVNMATILVEWFGNSVTFREEKDGFVTASVMSSELAMRYWVLQYAPYVTILSPQSLVDGVKADLTAALAKYE